MRRRPSLVVAAAVALVLSLGTSPARAEPRSTGAAPVASQGAAPAEPVVLAAVGDSITRAFDVRASRPLRDEPAYSWATGTKASVRSLATRLRARGTVLSAVHNDARTGARVADLDGQLAVAAEQGATRVVVLVGANDVCARSVAAMTSATTFRSRFAAALRRFSAARPDATIAVSSIPDIHRLWTTLHSHRAARSAWAAYGFCRSMLGARNSAADRRTVASRLKADNASLAAVCRTVPHCRFDGLATYRVRFTERQVSTVDFFHPSVTGQALLARTTATALGWE